MDELTKVNSTDKPENPKDNPENPKDKPEESKDKPGVSKKSKESKDKPGDESSKQNPFKKHPLLEKAKFHPEKIKGARRSNIDPHMNIIAQHERHRARLAIIVGVVFGIIMAAVFSVWGLQRWMREQERLERLADIEKRLEEHERRIGESEGYERSRQALAAASLVDRAYLLDIHNHEKWQQAKMKYVDVVAEGVPTEGDGFVNPAALIDMVFIPKGRFNMGRRHSDLGERDENPRRPIIIPDHFWMARFPNTVAQYRMVNPRFRIEPWKHYRLDGMNQPVVRVSWHDAMRFCAALNARAIQLGYLPAGYEYRLPTEAEWEYAARAGSDSIYYWGDSFGEEGAKYANSLDLRAAKIFDWRAGRDMAERDGFLVSSPVGSFKPNAFELQDMLGNVWEWCHDWYDPEAYSKLPAVAPVQTVPVEVDLKRLKSFDAGSYKLRATCRVLRGGSWGNLPADLRAARRFYDIPDETNTGFGFRVVLAKKVDSLTK